MDGQGVWEVLEVAGVPHHEGLHVVGAGRQEFAVGDAVDVVFGQAEDLPQFPDDRAVLEGAVRSHQRHVREPLEDVFRHVVPIRPREVDVEVRRIRAVQVDEPFEVEVEFNGVYVRDAQQIGDEAVGPASAPHIKVPAAARVAGDVPIDEEIGQIPLLPDDRQLHFHPLDDVFFVVGVAVSQPLGTQRPDELFVLIFRIGVGMLVVVRPAVRRVGQGDLACVEQRFGPLHPVGMLGERLMKIGGREQPVVRVAGGGFGQLAQQFVAAHGPQDAVAIPIAFVSERKGVQGDEPLVRHIGSAFEQTELGLFPRPHADVFIGPERVTRVLPPRPRVHDEGVFKGGRHGFKGPVDVQMGVEVRAQVGVPGVVAGVADVEGRAGGVAVRGGVTEIDAQDGTNTVLGGVAHKVPVGGRRVDVG